MSRSTLHTRVRSACLSLLATVALHPSAIAAQVQAPVAVVNDALRHDWQTFRQVAGDDCFHWTRSDNHIARAAQHDVVTAYAPGAYTSITHNENRDSRHVGQLTATVAICRALLAIGAGTVEELAAAAACEASTIQQQAARFAEFLTITKELAQGEKRRRWRITHIAMKAPIGSAT